MINHKLGQLYRHYKARRHPDIVTGGLVSEADYVLSKPRVVFVGKEVPTSFGRYSISKQMRKRAAKWEKGQDVWDETYGLVGLWAYGIMQGFPAWRVVNRNKRQCAAQGLRAIGITNLNLGPGTPVSNGAAVRRHALKADRRRLLAKELGVMSPDLVLCGYTFWDTIDALGLDRTEAKRVIRGRDDYYYVAASLGAHSTVLLDLSHPARKAHQAEYEQLRDLITKLRRMGVLN